MQKENPHNKPKPEAFQTNLGLGLSLGLCFGTAFGMIFDNLATGIGVGLALGLCFGLFRSSNGEKDQEADSFHEEP